VPFRGHHRFSDDVRQISADCKIPVQTGEAESGARDEAPAHSEESAKNADKKSDYRQIDGIDMGP
jgi:hypothetical protein